MRFFSYDSTFGRLFLKLSYGCCLNILWLVCCLPVFTIGASTTALYYSVIHSVKADDGYASHMFLRSFRRYFRQATILWLVLAVCFVLLIVMK